MFPAIYPPVQIVLLILVLAAAVFDVRYRRIPNWLTAGGVLVGFALNATLKTPFWLGLWFSFLGFALGFGIYCLLYLLRAMGAGDVKLMAAVGAMAGPSGWFGIFLVTALVGGVMALILVVAKRRVQQTFWNVNFILSEMRHLRPGYVGREELDVKNPKALGLPHGAVIAVGTLFFMAFSRYYPR